MHNEGDKAKAMSANCLVFHFQRLVHYSVPECPPSRSSSSQDCRVSCSCRCNCQVKLVLPCLPPEEGKELVERVWEGERRGNSFASCRQAFAVLPKQIKLWTHVRLQFYAPSLRSLPHPHPHPHPYPHPAHTHTHRGRGWVIEGGGQALWLCSECQRLHITATLIRSARHLSR